MSSQSKSDQSISDAADGLALWQEAKPRTLDDWKDIARRFSEEADRLRAENERLKAPQGWEDELNAAWAIVNQVRAENKLLRAERDRAVETRENANAATLRAEHERDALRAGNERLREELGYRPSDTNGYCTACGRYQPKTLGGDETACDCGRTPPASNLPPNIYVCPTCHGHGANPLGCWGTSAKPHEHAFMRPMLELLRGSVDEDGA